MQSTRARGPAEGAAESIHQLIAASASASSNAVALLGRAIPQLDYGTLSAKVEALGDALAGELELHKTDRIAIVLPNGPAMAVAFLAVASSAVAAPLNPGYRAAEFEFYLSDLQAKALLITPGIAPAALEAAKAQNVRIIQMELSSLALLDATKAPSTNRERPGPDDTALILHTSGTTSRPKIVPLTHANLTASARNIQKWLQLSPADRCLNVMPLFHIHGLVGALLSSMAAGASVVCTEGFVATEFWPQLSEYRPTWYTAVPTMHQAIVARAEPDGGANTAKLRFVRSASSALPPQTARGLEQIFNAPVVEAYGMTEAAHQMSCNPLPPARRKFGSVGQPAGPEIAIMDANGRLLRPKTQGEIVIRGRNVTAGYENNPAANAASFTNGWFRTGDLGRFDEDGYLFIDGRIKEIINRGGEKISPREIDEALLDHPAVLAAVTFAVPDPRLGEEIAAAVVLKKNATADEESLTRFAASRLADFKVPRRILIVDEIPKGPTGKVQRIGLAERLGLKDLHPQQPGVPTQAAPDSTTRSALARIWREVLKVREVRDRDEFLALGGDSILAAQVIARVWQQLGRKLPIHAFFGAATLTSVSAAIEAGVDNSATESVLQDIETMTDEEAERLLGGLSQTTTHGGGSR